MRRKLVKIRPGHIRSRRAKKAAITPIFVLHPSGSATHFSDCPALVCRGWLPWTTAASSFWRRKPATSDILITCPVFGVHYRSLRGATEQETGVSQRSPLEPPTFCEKRPSMAEWAHVRSQKAPCKSQTLCNNFCKGMGATY